METKDFEVPRRDGYIFEGYYVNNAGVIERMSDRWNYVGIDRAVASWSSISYTVSYDPNGGIGVMGIDHFDYGVTKALSTNRFSKDGYSFNGWMLENADGSRVDVRADYNESRLTTVNGKHITLIAKWQNSNYTVVYHGNRADRGVMTPDRATYGETYYIKDNTYERDGYEFIGFGKGTNSLAEFFRGSTLTDREAFKDPYDLYAQWIATKSVVAHLVLVGNGGTFNGAPIATIPLANQQVIANSIPKPTRKGYTQSRWMRPNGTGWTTYVLPERCDFEGTRVIYADWNPVRYEVRFNSNNGEYRVSTISVSYEDRINIPVINEWRLRGHVFKDWSDREVGYSSVHIAAPQTNYPVSDLVRDLNVTGDTINLYARWQGRRSRIVFVKNHESAVGNMPDQIATYGEGTRLDDLGYSLSGHAFTGWATSSNGSFAYVNGDYVDTVIGDNEQDVIYLYGKWSKVEGSETDGTNTHVTITYRPNGGYIAGSKNDYPVIATKGEGFVKVKAIWKGRNLVGYRNIYGDRIAEGQRIDRSTIAVAEWSDKTYNVIYVGGKGSTYVGTGVAVDGEVDGGTHSYSVGFNLPGEIFTKPGYTLASWSLSEKNRDRVYNKGAFVSELTENAVQKIYAVWSGNRYEIRYVGGLGAVGTINPTEFNYGDKALITDQVFSMVGMTQNAWKYTDSSGTPHLYGIGNNISIDSLDFEVPSSGYIELEAVYKNNDQPDSAVLNANGGYFDDGSTTMTVEIKPGEVVAFTEPRRTGYKFLSYYVDGHPVEDVWSYRGAKDVIASWSAINYRILFDSNDAENMSAMSFQDAEYDKDVKLPVNSFKKRGYRFGGWRLGTSTILNAATVSNLAVKDGDIVRLEAVWEPLTYEVVFRLMGGTEDASGQPTDAFVTSGLVYGEEMTLNENAFEWQGHTLLGWSRAKGKSITYEAGGTLNVREAYEPRVELFAKWEKNEDLISKFTIFGNGGYVYGKENSEMKYKLGEVIQEPYAFRDGYRIAGWEVEWIKGRDDEITTTDAAAPHLAGAARKIYVPYQFGKICEGEFDRQVRPIWEPLSYTTIFNSNDENYREYVDIATFGEAGHHVPQLEWEREGYEFSHWSDKRDGTGHHFDINAFYGKNGFGNYPIDEDVPEYYVNLLNNELVLYAIWEKKKVDITFNSAGGNGVMPNQTITYDQFERLTENKFTRPGYTFAGWATRSDGEVVYVDREEANYIVKNYQMYQPVTLYAVWVPEADAIKLVYKTREGHIEGGKSYALVVARNSLFKDLYTNRFGYTFDGYESEYGVARTATTRLSESTVSYAKWRTNSYTVKFDGRGATRGSTTDIGTTLFETPITLSANGYRKGGFSFKGWDVDPLAKTVVYTNNQVVRGLIHSGERKLYAVWQPFSIVISSNVSGLYGESPRLMGSDPYIDTLTNFPFTTPLIYGGPSGFWCTEVLTRQHYEHLGWKFTRSDGRVIYTTLGAPGQIDDDFLDDYEIADEADLLTFKDKFTPWWQGALSYVTLDGEGGTFKAYGDADEVSDYIRYEDYTAKFPEPTREGYTFNGYKVDTTDAFLTEQWLYGQYEYALTGVPVRLHGNWSPYNYTVKYDVKGGTPMISPELATYGETYTISTVDVKKEGHDFGGWRLVGTNDIYQRGVGVVNLSTQKDGEVTLEALWTPKKYSINYDANGGTGTMSPTPATYGEAVPLSASTFTRDGYNFNGWSLDKNSESGEYTAGGTYGNRGEAYRDVVTLYATWIDPNAIRGTLILDGNGGTVAGLPVFIKGYRDGETIGEIKKEKKGYKFLRWATNSVTVTIPLTCNFDGEFRAKAEWGDKIRYNVTYHANDGTGRIHDGDRNIEYDTDYYLRDSRTTFTRQNYDLIGWSLSAGDNTVTYPCDATRSNLTDEDGKTIHLYGVWEPTRFTIKYDKNDGTDTVITENFEYGSGRYLRETPFTWAGYVFSGWTTSSASNVYDVDYYDGTEADEVFDGEGRKSEITLYAIWAIREQTILMTFDGNTGTIYGKNTLTAYLMVGSRLKYPTAKKPGYYYTDWLDTDKITIYNATVVPSADKTIYVAWLQGNYNLSYVGFDATGGAMAGRNNIPFNLEFKLDPNGFTRIGYDFKGWDTSEDANVAVYLDEASVSQLGLHSETVFLYTVWGEKEYTINYVESGVVVAPDTLMHSKGRALRTKTGLPIGYSYYYTSPQNPGRDFNGGETVTIADFPGLTTNIITMELQTNRQKYTGTFRANGGIYADGSTVKSFDEYYGDPLASPADIPTYGTRKFLGYKVDGQYYTQASYSFLESKTFVADWEKYSYEISFNKNIPVSPGGYANNVNGNMATQSYTEGVEQGLYGNTYSLSGYDFIGWATASYTPAEVEQIRADADRRNLIIGDSDAIAFYQDGSGVITLYAMWARHEYHITLGQNETYASIKDPFATISSLLLFDQRFGDAAAFASGLTRTGYKPFTGIFTTRPITSPYDKAHFSGVEGVDYYTFDSVMRGGADLTLYPLWQNEEYTLRLDIKDGTYSNAYADNSVTVYYDAPYFTKGSTSEPRNADGSIVAPKASDSAMSMFEYWSLDLAGTNRLDGNALYLDPSVTELHANYKTRGKFYVTYKANGGYGDDISVPVYEGNAHEVRECTFTRGGRSFNGWQYTYGGRVTTYYPHDVIYPAHSMTLEASWARGGSGNNGSTGGTGGSGGGKKDIQRNIIYAAFVLDDVLPSGDEGSWIYDAVTDKWAYKISINTDIAKALDKAGLRNQQFTIMPDGEYIKLINGVYRIFHYDDAYYFTFDENGVMHTGFLAETLGTHHYTVDFETLDLIDGGSIGEAKYYLMEQGKYKGAVWNQTITIDGVTIFFDEQGRIINELAINKLLPSELPTVDASNTVVSNVVAESGAWEYEPEDDTWKYAKIDSSGNKIYLKDGAFELPSYGGKYYFVFDENGKMKVGLTEYNGNKYYLREVGALKGVVYTGPLILGDMYYDFDGTGVMVNEMTLAQAMTLTQQDPEFALQLVQAMTASQVEK